MSRARAAGISFGTVVAFWCAIAVLFGIAAWQRFSLDSLPFCDGDFWGYLHPALGKLQGEGFVHTFARSFPYPGFLYVILALSGAMQTVTIVQHVLGLFAGLALLLAWLRLRCLLPERAWMRVIHRLLALPLVAGLLFSSSVVQMEHSLRPEAVLPFFLALLPLLAACVLDEAVKAAPQRATILGFGSLLLIDTGLLYFLKPHFAFAVPVTIVFMTWVGVRARLGLKGAAALFALPALVVGVTLWWPERQLAAEDGVAARFLPGTLLWWHMDLAEPLLRADAENPLLDANDRAFRAQLADIYRKEREEYEASDSHNYGQLGFNPDRLLYGQANRLLEAHLHDDNDAYRAFCLNTFARTVSARPHDYLHKIGRQLELVYVSSPDLFERPASMNAGTQFRQTAEVLEKYTAQGDFGALGQAYLQRARELSGDRTLYAFGDARWEAPHTEAFHWLEQQSLPLMIGAGFAGVLLLLRHAVERLRRKPGLPLGLALLAFVLAVDGWSFGLHLTAAAIHSLDVHRYIYMQHALSLSLIFFHALFVIVALRGAVIGHDGAAPGTQSADATAGAERAVTA